MTHPNPPPPPDDLHWHILKARLSREAARMGLGTLAITPATPADSYERYEAWIEAGYHGEMGYLARDDRLIRRRDMQVILEGARSVIVVALPYWPGSFPPAQQDPMRGVVSCYAWGRDYHKILEKKLKRLSRWLCAEGGGAAKFYVDTGAIQERDLAARAGLGFIGKHTLLIHPRYGSGVFLGEIITTLPLPADEALPMPDCGQCTKCLTACPTDAFIGPHVLDARKCISYLTIELKGSIPVAYRPLIGNMIYGCDICQQVCPWTRFAGDGDSPLWGSPADEVAAPKLLELLALDDESFQERYQGTPIRRLGRARLLRNVTVALGNTLDKSVLPTLQKALRDHEPLIVEHAAWAIAHIEAAHA